MLFLDDHDHLGGVQPLQQPGEELDQGYPQEVIIGKVIIINVLGGDSDVCNLLFMDNMTLLLEAYPSNSQEKSLIRDTPRT